MAVFPTPAFVSAEEYLNSSYHPDKEYVDGVLVDRGMPTIRHSLLQRILIRHFGPYEEGLRFLALPEVRTQIIESARYRIPDVMLCPIPLPEGKVIVTIPCAIIEILSPDDKIRQQIKRFRDYAGIGVGLIVLLDPERLVAYRLEDGHLIKTPFTEFLLPSGSIPFDTEALFRQLVEERNAGR